MIYARFDENGIFNVQSQTNNNGPNDGLDWVLVLCELPDLWTPEAIERMTTNEGYCLQICPHDDGAINATILGDWVCEHIGKEYFMGLLADQMGCDEIFHTVDQIG